MTLTPAPLDTLPDDGLWLSVSEIAARKGVSKQAISARAAPLIAGGRLMVRPGKGNAKLINLAQYDTLIGQVGNAAREAGASTANAGASSRGARGGDTRFRDEQAREKAYAADLKWIELEQARGNLVPTHDIDEVAEETGRRILDVLESLPGHAEDLTGIAARDGWHGLHQALKQIVRGQREAISQSMKEMVEASKARANNQVFRNVPASPAAADHEGDSDQ
ncbi:hypothetical protein JQ604_12115 [Bradyrhizobium jicamae]|uniref:hypothetical protein n=1 Tax=Bradyrhizobium jicamae TaxID=280332 RepID=UPI001BABC03B|nr:hypothetical protein [Bradyrhizobium jicamae]MBR0752931.1 hypothetical protein [Bradyrhizobium jicamae]